MVNVERPHIAVVGAGRMGRSIAIAFAYGGYEVDVVDFKARADDTFPRLATEARAEILATLGSLASLGAMPRDAVANIADRVTFIPEAASEAVLRRADVVFEAVPETLEAKRDALGRISAVVTAGATIASTTSTMLSTELAGFVARPERFLNAHWLNPAFLVPLVELSPHPTTSRHVVAWLRAMLEDIGKVPVECAPSPGFIVPRLQALIMNEAARMVEEGVATAEEIDRATRYGLGLRFASLGVLEFIDYGGNDILHHASRYLAERVSRERFAAPDIVDRHMREGRNGLKSGDGFLDHTGRDEAAYRQDVLARTLGMLRHFGLHRAPR
jgi:3-hydroxybutyryl-CoA dehydrogenase